MKQGTLVGIGALAAVAGAGVYVAHKKGWFGAPAAPLNPGGNLPPAKVGAPAVPASKGQSWLDTITKDALAVYGAYQASSHGGTDGTSGGTAASSKAAAKGG